MDRRNFVGTILGIGSDMTFNGGKTATYFLEKLADFGVENAEAYKVN